MTDLDDSFLGSFLSSLERGERERSRRELREDLSLLRLLLRVREGKMEATQHNGKSDLSQLCKI